ncbi:2OG-Fe(II) oxygenase [Nonomuraea roseoviolacea]|uniref:Rps23 Pro-64 3,4-dihydroxylase Tpa1-like proline 4-hydroxylase n=1 Tax=Nonomuraea roseoviolacea subsp. carminata TaxID=160689 RepID=A0ABT1JY55_9ACTN|nr:2OG-Fe(II) oxygenase [Nonomuraea roseoviolacea]MCP2346688.1 Rps23 Pro-64 3,4-dihydroxylase Tpa1-like proline 4-hydroxylase [Nonomuraea roseoviolacea subsp. carminata]
MQQALSFTFHRDELLPLADSHRESFLKATPFRHVVIDDFLPAEVLEPVLAEFPEPRDIEWQRFDNAREVKLALADTERMGPATRHLLAEFNGQVFIDFLERLTGIEHLVSDPHYDGGGLHQIRPGGFLKVHVDFNRHRRLDLDRRLNGLLYLNKDWEESYGGHLQLWNKDMTTCEHRILPVFNRFVLFATTDEANHGHPEPLTCPDDRARRSMALYYYTNGRPEEEVLDEHDTKFKQRPGEEWKTSFRQTARRWVPPALADLASRRK